MQMELPLPLPAMSCAFGTASEELHQRGADRPFQAPKGMHIQGSEEVLTLREPLDR